MIKAATKALKTDKGFVYTYERNGIITEMEAAIKKARKAGVRLKIRPGKLVVLSELSINSLVVDAMYGDEKSGAYVALMTEATRVIGF